MLRQRHRERAVLAVAIRRRRAGLGRIGDQHVRAGRLDLGQALPDRARRDGSFHVLGERIVPAGVENHQPQLLGGFDRQQHAVQRKRLVIDVGVAFQLGIHRNQVIRAVHLDAVAGVIDHGDIGIARAVGKIAQRAAGFGRRQIVAGIDDVEAGILQCRGDHGAVIDRVRQLRHVLIGRIAEHQRHALFGPCRLAHQQQRSRQRGRTGVNFRDPGDFIMTRPNGSRSALSLPTRTPRPGLVSQVTLKPAWIAAYPPVKRRNGTPCH